MRSTVFAIATLAAVAVAVAAVSGSSEPPTVNDRARLLKEFEDRAAIYSQLSRKAAASVPPLPDKATPEQIAAHQKALAKAIQASRAGAFQGEILFDGVVPVFLELLRSDLDGAKGRDAREAIKEDNPRSDHPVPTLPNEPSRTALRVFTLLARASDAQAPAAARAAIALHQAMPQLERPGYDELWELSRR